MQIKNTLNLLRQSIEALLCAYHRIQWENYAQNCVEVNVILFALNPSSSSSSSLMTQTKIILNSKNIDIGSTALIGWRSRILWMFFFFSLCPIYRTARLESTPHTLNSECIQKICKWFGEKGFIDTVSICKQRWCAIRSTKLLIMLKFICFIDRLKCKNEVTAW